MALPILLFSFFIYFLFAYACESKKRGFTLHICAESPINRGDSWREPSLHRYSPKRHKWRKTVNPLWQKSPKCERFFLQKTQAARPEGAEAHSPGQRPGYKAISNAPCKGKSFKTPGNFLKLLPLQVGCVGQTFERGIWQQNHGSECDKRGTECDKRGSECDKRGSECDKRGSEKREKNSRKRIDSQKKWLSLQNERISLDRAFCTAWSRSNWPSLGR